ncbi:MAG TPA: amidase [Candidatus Tectomicrobia bacterium]|nr:amidase [Candidatus Tectomicrobia bacterium]
MDKSELCFLSAAELAPQVRKRAVSPVEIVEALLDRIEALNDNLRAYLYIANDQALAAARAAELEIGAGSYRGPLHGIPVAYKDIYDVAGMPTTAASKVMAGYLADADCTVAARLRRAGAICLGKLNTHEFASGSMEVFGSARNPWNTELVPGGSSSGSGTALAAHLVTGATGSDTGGSVRNPASFCGIVGLKPTYGRISRAGIIPLSWSLDHAGPMARTVADIALLLQAMAGPDRRDRSAALQPVPDYQAGLRGDLQSIRIGVPRTYFFEHGDPEVIAAVRTAIEAMQQLGASVCDIDLPHAFLGPAASWAIAYSESFTYHRANFFARARDYTPAFLHKIAGAAFLAAEERITAQRLRQVITAEFLGALQTVDIIVSPTTAYPAYPIGGSSPQADMRSLTRPVSLTGLPALALPCGFTRAGLPVSMQLIGRAWEENTVLRVGYAYEQAAGWYRRRAPIEPGPIPHALPTALPRSGAVDAQWVLDFARLTGLSFIAESDAGPIAASIAPVKAMLAESRASLEAGIEPPVRSAPAS